MNPIDKAVSVLGSQQALAEKIGVTPQAVNQWVKRRRPVPSGRCLSIEEATAGAVTAKELRPDVFGRVRFETSPYMAKGPENKNGSGRHGASAAE